MKFSLQKFYRFCSALRIDSKEKGLITLSPKNWLGTQSYFIEEVARGLEEGVHYFVALKCRQAGISTICLALDLFWVFLHRGLSGAFVCHEDAARDMFRTTLDMYMDGLPDEWKIEMASHNRNQLVLENRSRLLYRVAGTKKNTNFGRGSALTFVHATEMSSWGDPEGLASLEASLAESNPNRLYLWESTARGPNMFQDQWEVATRAKMQRAIFIGWWRNQFYRAEPGSMIHQVYWDGRLTPDERMWVRDVKNLYGFQITDPQIAWWRYQVNEVIKDDILAQQEHPWTAEQAFVLTGSQFFSAKRLSQEMRAVKELKPLNYRFVLSQNFEDTDLVESNARLATLKIWAPPVPGAYYAIGADPAWGSSEWADRFAIEVFRCYADGMDQVAEFCTADLSTYQFAWILAYLCGAYGNSMLNLEVNGPGAAVLAELKNLRRLAVNTEGKLGAGMMRVLENMQHFLYDRPDAIHGMPTAYHWKALSLDTPLPTPSGWTTMGDVKKGDYVLSDDGRPTEVVATSDVMLDHSCSRITFDDGSSIVADDEHLWGLSGGQIVKTYSLREGDLIAVSKPLRLSRGDFPIDPYLLGVWLGDGYSESGKICGSLEDLSEIADLISGRGDTIKSVREDPRNGLHRISIGGLTSRLREFGLLKDKSIPPEYLRGSRTQRLELLRGLMDTDGSISEDRQCSFTTTNGKIASGFAELLRTLGIKVKFCLRNRVLMYKGEQRECAQARQFTFTAYPDVLVFNLRRKRDRQESGAKFRPCRSKCHVVISIDPVESVPVRCIQVDSESRLYLAGEGMVPTHNTTGDTKELMLNVFKDAFERGIFKPASPELIAEMKNVRRDDGVIGAPGRGKDDRVIASALASVAWAKWVQPRLQVMKMTRTHEQNRESADTEPKITSAVQSYLRRIGVAVEGRG